MFTINDNQGFAILASALLLCIAGIIFTVNMACSQLIDNQLMGNYYRNHEAFVNAESGVDLMLSKIDQSTSLLNALPFSYHPPGSPFTVTVDRLNKNTVSITSLATSNDGSAQRQIYLEVNHEVTYKLPLAALSSNGKLNLDSNATINDGCEGVSLADCKSPGNIAKFQLVSQPSKETESSGECSESALGENVIDQNALYGEKINNNFLTIGEKISVIDKYGNRTLKTISWPRNTANDDNFYGLKVNENLSPSSLLESTLGVTREDALVELNHSPDVQRIDMNDGNQTSCSTRLQELDPSISTIYIKGDCNIEPHDPLVYSPSIDKRFTVGSVDNPKLIFMEGGTFTHESSDGVSVIGLLYFLPNMVDKIDPQGRPVIDPNNANQYLQVEKASVDLGGIRVNGALLSEYDCSYNGLDKLDKTGKKQHFSVRYDKTVLNKLYENLQRRSIDSGYSIINGSWKDF